MAVGQPPGRTGGLDGAVPEVSFRRPPGRGSVLVALSVLALSACGSPANTDGAGRDPLSGAITEGGEVGTQRLQVGDCFIDSAEGSTQLVQGVPCAELHDSQVAALVELDDDGSTDWPGVSQLLDRAQLLCFGAASDALDGNLTDLTVGLSAYVPDEDSWNEGDRRVICSLGRFDGSLMSGSLLGRPT